ncbi:MAG: polysaccharide biosynthesis/export family protein [Bacteroidales bacterium]|nr:polysaccharide biosynthesis/export family protein [Bacteroidales bacterium]MBN2755988.1 polysaccharide biosynthesis/export family protein [Bacteroidales bacterium]
MKYKLHKRGNLLIISSLLFLLLYLSSCVTQNKVKYVQTKVNDTLNTFILKQRPLNKIQPFDNLYIKIISPDIVTSAMFNSESMNVQTVNYNMISYSVNEEGKIIFPFVGEISVKDLTITQAKDSIQLALNRYISNSDVVVKFVGKDITIIGEVMRQGQYVIYSDNVNIFRALAMSGGLTDFGNRKNVTIIREFNGEAKFYYIDLTDKKIMLSNFYYLKPDDIIIVQPLKQKTFGFASVPYTLLLTSITTILAFMTFLRTM